MLEGNRTWALVFLGLVAASIVILISMPSAVEAGTPNDITVTVNDSGGTADTVTIQVGISSSSGVPSGAVYTDPDSVSALYDDNSDGSISRKEVTSAVNAYFNNQLEREDITVLVNDYFAS